jgi:large subunit ribosomal protein L10
MEGPRPAKVAVVQELIEKLGSAPTVVVTEYRGLKVSDLEALRQELREAGATFKIYKNTLVRLAVRQAGLEAMEPLLVGPTALVFVDGDIAQSAKKLRDFSRQNPLLVVKGGLLAGAPVDQQAIARLADLPPREVLLAQLGGVMAAPMRNFAGLLAALPRDLAYGLVALRDKQAA